MRFQNKKVLITGAGCGIGRATALRFAEEGADLALFDINASTLSTVKKELAAYASSVCTYVLDITDEAAVKRAVADAEKQLGGMDILVNNAGYWRVNKPFDDCEAALWDQMFQINLMGAVYCIQSVLPAMKAQKFGRIINVASVAGVYGNARMVPYSASKAAMIAMTKGLAKEIAAFGITCNATAPGTVSDARNPDIDAVGKNDLNYMGRSGSDRENADLILYLADNSSSYISGQVIQLDGCRKIV
ncbi:MAG: SDR family oxidoreductase [Clostridia bacterium]|nr:SDR family oxidoreductase [Clostridia bacterium]